MADAIRQRVRQAPDNSRKLWFSLLPGKYVSKHTGGRNVDIVRVTDWFSTEKALLFRTPLNEDLDGAPNSYAPPVSASDVSPRNGLVALENIKNATNQKGQVFHDNPALNTFSWTGVMSAKHTDAAARRLDERAFLRDTDGKFPMFQPETSATRDYYAPRTARATVDRAGREPPGGSLCRAEHGPGGQWARGTG